MAEPQEIVLAVTTFGDVAAAERMTRILVEERLIACANIVPGVTSLFRWEDELRREAEVLVVMKTVRARVPQLMERASRLHPYEVPELVAVPVAAVADAYGEWVRRETLEVSE